MKFLLNVLFVVVASMSINSFGMTKVSKTRASHVFTVKTIVKGYPELAKRNFYIEDVKRTSQFLVFQDKVKGIDRDCVGVAFGDEDIVKAKQLKQKGASLTHQEVALQLMYLGRKDIVNTFYTPRNMPMVKVWLPILYSILETSGIACRFSTLDLWQGILYHEGAHLYFNDSKNNISLAQKLQKLKDPQHVTHLNMLDCLEEIIPHFKRYCIAEYRADQEAIKRITDVKVLEALTDHFKSSALYTEIVGKIVHKTRSERVNNIFQEHLEMSERATLFENALLSFKQKQACNKV